MDEKKKLLTPKFLTERLITDAVISVMSKFADFARERLGSGRDCPDCHVVVLGPGMEDARKEDYPDWPDYPVKPVVLAEYPFGNQEEWRHKFNEIARCKAMQLWGDRHDGGAGMFAHLLFPGDTPFWGGVKTEGIVVSCSGLPPWLDKMVAGMIACMIIGLAREAYERSEDKKNDVNFLS